MEIEDLPYRAEYAKSARANCKGCKSSIGKDTLRLAVMVQSPFFDGKQPNWYHMSCFFGKQRPKAVGDIAHFESLRFEDQEKLREKIANASTIVVPDKKGKKRANNSAGTSTSSKGALKDFNIEYAKSGRAGCRGCEQKILKGEIRISKKDFETDVGKRYGGQDMWHHLDCFAKLRSELGYFACGSALPGFQSLSIEDKEKAKKELPPIKQEEDSTPAKKPKKEDEVDGIDKNKVKKQSDILFKYRDLLKTNLKRSNLKFLLEYNDQDVPEGDEPALDRLADNMTFGALERCSKCKGQFVFHKSYYICQGNITEWTKCLDKVEKPNRLPFKVPDEYKEKFEFFKKYKYVPRNRIYQYNISTVSKDVKKEDVTDSGPKVERAKPALYNMNFIIAGIKSKDKKKLEEGIVKLGGKVLKSHSDENQVMAVISNKATMDADETDRLIKIAKKKNIHVVSDCFVTDAKNYAEKIPELVIKKSICDWGSDPASRIPVEDSVNKSKLKSKSMFTKSVPKSVTMKIKGGGAVDPDSGLDDIAHVYQKGPDKYTAVLGLTDLQRGKNSYYKLQVLEDDRKNRYWLFRSWGRIATTIGGNKLEGPMGLGEAKSLFEELYLKESGNEWSQRHNFIKIPNRKYPIDIDDSHEEGEIMNLEQDDSSKLAKPVQDLIRFIFDINSMKKVMLQFELDTEKMPLGKLSKKQIQSAFAVLSELQKLIEDKASEHNFIDACNRFYTLIPHSFGIDNPPIINTSEMIKEKTEMLDSLMELEVAYNLMKCSRDSKSGSAIDSHYEQLKTEIDILSKDSEEFHLLQQYVKNTHADTHTSYELEIEEVFVIKRHGEEKRFKPFKKLHNRKLLWHGSRTTNFAGILAQGLRIAPAEAPVTGYMFGKGIYFADMVSKSANYCCTNSEDPKGLLLLCEVALGEMYERQKADYIEKLPKGKHSTKGVGMTQPNPDEAIVKDGVEIPLGKPMKENNVKTSLLYNEYIVYDVAQVNAKYLMKMHFKYRS